MNKLILGLKPYKWYLVLLLVVTIAQTYAVLALPDYTARIINEGIASQDNSIVFRIGSEMLIVALIGGLLTIVIGYLASRIATGYSRNLRAEIFTKIESFSLSEFNTLTTSSLITRSTNDVQQIQQVLLIILRIALMAPITGIGAIIKAYSLAPNMTWLMAVAVAIIVSVIAFLFTFAIPKFKLLQKLVDQLNLVSREMLTGTRVVRAFNREKHEEKRFNKINIDLTEVNLVVNRLMIVLQPIMMLVMNILIVGIVWLGAYRVSSIELQIGDLLAFMQYAIQTVTAFLMISIVFILVPRASVSATRLSEVLDTDPKIKKPTDALSLPDIETARIEFKNVSFAYSNNGPVFLKNISFIAEPNQTTAIIGSTGSGKSTIVNLLPRFYDISSGQILFNGVDTKLVDPEELHSQIGYVPQKTTLYSGTMKSNILYGAKDTSEKNAIHAAKIAQADNFIQKLKKKYNATVEQGGSNLSGGQKQRLSIARAIARKPAVLIFDDCFSALDMKTDYLLRQALEPEVKTKTVITVAQRISTVMNADKILVIDEGRIVGFGTHLELLKSSKVYQEIALSQLSSEELEKSGIINE